MRRSAQRRRFGFTLTLVTPAAIALAIPLLTGCEDSRISVQEFIAMQQRMDRENGARNGVPPRCAPKPAVSPEDADSLSKPCRRPAPRHCAPPNRADQKPAHEAPRPEPAHTESSAVRASRVIQVNAPVADEETPNRPNENWFFDTARGEWVKVKLPRKAKPRVQPTSLYANQNASYYVEPDAVDDDDPATDNATTSDDEQWATLDRTFDRPTVEPATPSAMPHFVPVQSNVPIRNEPLQPISDLVQLAKRPYLLGPEDLLTVTLTGLTGIDTIAEPAAIEVRIDNDGTINLPLIGEVNIEGLGIMSAENVIREAYVPKFVPTLAVGIRVEQYKTTDVVVVGAAVLPGIVNLRRNQRTVLHAVAAAGGMTQIASGEVVLQRMRDPDNKIHVYLRNSADLQSVLSMDPLDSGDVIDVVAAQPNTIFVGGLVNLPGPREFPPGTEVTALQALAAAGGPVETVYPKEATLIRRMPNGEDVHVRIDLDKLRSGEDPNLELKPGDIFWLPETFGTRAMAFINQSFFIRAGATVSYNVTGIEFLNRARQQVGNVGQTGGGTLQNNVDPLGFLAP